jgi:plastocyanin
VKQIMLMKIAYYLAALRSAPAIAVAAMLTASCGRTDISVTPAAAGTALPAASAAVDGSDSTVEVPIKDFKFLPTAELTITPGTTVVWTNEDEGAPHNVETADGYFRSDELLRGERYSHTFDTKGRFEYICGLHPYMKGTIIVR